MPLSRRNSPPITHEMADHIRFLVNKQGLFQHQVASVLGINQGRVSEVMTGKAFPKSEPKQGRFPF